MLNKNTGVQIAAEPLLPVINLKSPEAELKALTDAVGSLESKPNVRVLGFNEKFLSRRYSLPSSEEHFQKLHDYLNAKNFKLICDMFRT